MNDRPKCAWLLTDLNQVAQNGVRVMTTFSCGGGSSMGYKLAGCDVVAANDIDPVMAAHYKRNLRPANYFLGPIAGVTKAPTLPDDVLSIDILDGSPPCSTFSMAGQREKNWGKNKAFREGQATQVLSDLFFDFLDLASRLRPKVVIAENVKGMMIGNAKGYTKAVIRRFEELGYRVQLFLLNAADFGVPQRRERVFFVASRVDLGLPKLTMPAKTAWVSVGEATADVQELTSKEASSSRFNKESDLLWWHKTRPGESYCDAVERDGLKGKLWSHCKLHSGEPSQTLTTTSHTLTHWSCPRPLTLREWVRIGGFPDDYAFDNDKIGKYMIGMSVPPPMMKGVASSVVQQWFNHAVR